MEKKFIFNISGGVNNIGGTINGGTFIGQQTVFASPAEGEKPCEAKYIDAEEAEVVLTDEDGKTDLPNLFKPAINVERVLEALAGIMTDKGDAAHRQMKSLKDWFVVHKVFKEIDWLDDTQQTHFIAWVEQAFGWPWGTRDFKSVLPGFKETPTMQWGDNTVKDRNTGREYRALADHIRSTFIELKGGKIKDREVFVNLGTDGQPMHIYHPSIR